MNDRRRLWDGRGGWRSLCAGVVFATLGSVFLWMMAAGMQPASAGPHDGRSSAAPFLSQREPGGHGRGSSVAVNGIGSISGVVTYTGQVTTPHNIIVIVIRPGEQQPAYAAVIAGAGPYTVGNVTDGVYTVAAFMDLGDDMGPPQPGEPFAWHDPGGDGQPDPVTVTGGNAVTGVNIALRDPAPPANGSIAGQISYTGRITGAHTIIVFVAQQGAAGPPAYHTLLAGPGAYTITGVADGVYVVGAYMDLDGDMAPPEADEPAAYHDVNEDGQPDPVPVSGTPVTGIDIVLRDPTRRIYLPLIFK
jgi:hypothetical protein